MRDFASGPSRRPCPERADLVVGISSYNSARTIGHVINQVARGLATYFSNEEALIVVSDGNSTDGTFEVANAVDLPHGIERVVARYPGVPGKGSAVLYTLRIAEQLDAKAIALVDSDLRSIGPEWMRLLLGPIREGADLVVPSYVRHKYDGTITNNFAYPFTRALYGKRIRQPIGGDFGISQRLAKALLNSRLTSNEYVPRFGIDIFITHTALHEKSPIVEAVLGSKIHETKDPARQLKPMFNQVAGSMFSCMIEYEATWRRILKSESVPSIKIDLNFPSPDPVQVNYETLVSAHKNDLIKYDHLLRRILPSDLHRQLVNLPSRLGDFSFPPDLWARIAYAFASTFKKMQGAIEREELLRALEACWIGKVASFIRETLDSSDIEAENKVIEEAAIFEEEKPYLLEIY